VPGEGRSAGSTRTIGIAIDVPEPYAGELRSWRKRVGDPQAEIVPPHVTLMPPTEIPCPDLPAVEDHLAAVAAR
jgi:2'-5' RNA ligase